MEARWGKVGPTVFLSYLSLLPFLVYSDKCVRNTRSRNHLAIFRRGGRLGGDQIADNQVVADVLHLLDVVLEPVAPAPERVVLEVEHLEAGVDVLDKRADQLRPLEVALGDGVGHQPGLIAVCQKASMADGGLLSYQLLDQADDGMEVLFERDVKLVLRL